MTASDTTCADAARKDATTPDAACADAVRANVTAPDAIRADAARTDMACADVARTDVTVPDAVRTDMACADAARTDAIRADAIAGLLGALTTEHKVPGAQLVVRRGGETVAAEVGEQLAGSGDGVTASCAFPLGSLTKPFTATLALMLVEDGDVDLDEPLGRYLPSPVPPITLRQVLSHTSGLASGVAEDTTMTTDPGRWVRAHCTPDSLVHRPGSAFSYSNAGYLLAGYLVEAVTGMGWAEAVTSMLLAPLGITPSFVVGPTTGRAALPGHSRGVVIREQDLPEVEAAAGALALSAADLAVFARLHLGEPGLPRLLDADLLREMRADHAPDGPFGLADGWGLGWSVYRRGGRTWHGHDGTGSGTSCHLRFDAESGDLVAFTGNAGSGLALWEDLVGELRAGGFDVGSASYSSLAGPGRPVPAPSWCAGRFTNGDTEFTFEPRDGGIGLSIGGEPYAELSLVDGLRFTLREIDGGSVHTGRFLRVGGVECVQLVGRLARRSM